ncbi:HAUS augmin-like complex subunit 6 N-terminus-domain-containing protein [Macrophomina phaseolina]|uniref:HAUS augmin-like complex subunit 6 N-terminus-domain-containing protein n=1 Tax=Macrophomina phaseolina TaxID=35725 RepID=A0ABQ8GEI2_9PEZI|nr:HAUS augmin-like complex subunit 6 N-terminus-domain-containing protein [Macrophomina phaseolina]
MSRPLSGHGSHTQSAASAAAKPLSLEGCSHQLSSPTLFVRNLRLLEFDRCDDWPEITVHTFATKDAQQNQKRRIQCTEWALFRLFELWDPDETREKLSPFFPPLEPLQSLNLRGALYRCLNDLKKNGVLGRETVLRKTMLDECKGDKFMEILVAFSTAVLKKTLSRSRPRRKNVPVARQYATATSLSLNQQASLLPLAIAHKAALTNVLRRRDDMRERYMDFGDLLDQKSEEAVERNERCGEVLGALEESGKGLPDVESIKRILHENWLGNPEWLELMVQGDRTEPDGGLFQTPFEHIWERVKRGQEIEEEPAHHLSLLQDLEARVKGQEERLSRWKAFHESLQASRPEEPHTEATKARNSSIDFTFDRHQELHLGRRAMRESDENDYAHLRSSDLAQSYGSILDRMRDDLAAASKVKSGRPPPKFVHKPKQSSIPMQPAAQRPTFVSRPRAKSRPVGPPSPEPEKASQPSFNRPISPDWFSPLGKAQPPELTSDPEQEEPARSLSPTPTRSTFHDHSPQEQHAFDSEENRPDMLHSPEPLVEEPASLERRRSSSPPAPSSPPNPEDLLAEQILAGIEAASPSPVKQPYLTLMERTRLTMEGRYTSPAKPSPTPRPLPPEEQARADATAALIERTRQTMLAMAEKSPAPAPNAKAGAGRTRSKTRRRSSLFPPNPWETRKTATRMEEEERNPGSAAGRATPKDKLFEEDVDEQSVFKSRPKIAASPLMVPDDEGDGDGDGISELGVASADEVEFGEEESGFGELERSPLRGKGR